MKTALIDGRNPPAAGKTAAGPGELARHFPPFVLRLLLLFVAYTAAAYVGLNWARVEGAGSPVWPAAGVGLAGLMIGGIRLWPAILLGRLAAAWLSGSQQPLTAELLIAGGNAVSAVIPALLLRYYTIDIALADLRSLLRYLFMGGVSAAVISATIGSLTLSASSGLNTEQTVSVFTYWATGSFVGAIIVGPLIQSWYARPLPPKPLYLATIVIATGLASWLIFTDTSGPSLRSWHVVPLLIWAAFAFDIRGASLALFVASFFAVLGTASGGVSVGESWMPISERMAILQQFLAVVGSTMLLLAATNDERHRRSEENLRLALEATGQGTFEYDIGAEKVRLDDQAKLLLGVESDDEFVDRGLVNERIVDVDQSAQQAAFKRAIAVDGDGLYSNEHRIVDAEGAERWVYVHGRASFIGTGPWMRPVLIRGTIRDITSDKAAEERISESARFTRRVLDNLFAFVGVLTPDGTVIDANHAPLAVAGIEKDEVLGRKFWDCYWWQNSQEERDRLKAAIASALRGEPIRYDAQIQVAGGRLIWIDFQIGPIYDDKGNITHLIPSGIDLTARKQAESESRRLTSIIEAAPDFIGIAGRDGRVQYLSPGALAMLGVEDGSTYIDAPIGVCHTEDSARRIREEAMPAADREGIWKGETEIVDRNGGIIPASQVILAHRNESGAVDHFSTIVRDISERKNAERHQALLLRELSHRVKNTLAVIQSIARQTLRDNVDPATFVKVFEGRIASIAASHELLTDTDWRGANFNRIIDHQLKPVVGGDFERRVKTSGPRLRLPSETATQVGLVLHELATNAVKHGALSTRNGLVELTWKLDAPGQLHVHWKELGGPQVTEPSGGTGFGTRLIDMTSRHVERSFGPEGFEIHLDIVFSPERADN